MTTWSFCSTNFNKANVIKQSVESMISSAPEDGEVIIVDGGSTDESIDILHQLEEQHESLRVLIRDCSLGEGRQLAFEASKGDYIVQQLDTDQEYHCLDSYLKYYSKIKSKYEDLVLATTDSVYISARSTVEKVGGYPPLSRVDERVFIDRADEHATLRILPLSCSKELEERTETSIQNRVRRWYLTSRDLCRVGFKLPQLLAYNYSEFKGRKVFIPDIIAILGWATAAGSRAEDYERPRCDWQEIASWQYSIGTMHGPSEKVVLCPEEFFGMHDKPLHCASLTEPLSSIARK